jgi:hypothetical protein
MASGYRYTSSSGVYRAKNAKAHRKLTPCGAQTRSRKILMVAVYCGFAKT